MKLAFPPLYAIMDAVTLASAGVLRNAELLIAEMLADAGVELIQYRDKQLSPLRLFQLAGEWIPRLRAHGARLVVNDRADVASLAAAPAVHLGQQDLPVEAARRLCGPDTLIGISTHNFEQVRAAEATSAGYVAFGPVFPTTTKEKPEPVVGVEALRRARELTAKPLVAIGGITLERAAEVYAAGADCLAVASDLIRAADPPARARQYLEVAAASRRRPGAG